MVGLPRSGTTVVANYINSMNSAFCFIEPHWEFKHAGTTGFFRDPKLRWIFFLKYRENARLPLDGAVGRLQRRYDLVAIKETFRGDHYAPYDPDLPNETLLKSYIDAGYRLVPIIRHPLAVWNSFRGHFVPQDEWAADLPAFIENYRRLCEIAAADVALIYERFVQDPAQELARCGISSRGHGGQLTQRKARMGDALAKQSTAVRKIERPVHYTPEQREELEASPIMDMYEAARARKVSERPWDLPD